MEKELLEPPLGVFFGRSWLQKPTKKHLRNWWILTISFTFVSKSVCETNFKNIYYMKSRCAGKWHFQASGASLKVKIPLVKKNEQKDRQNSSGWAKTSICRSGSLGNHWRSKVRVSSVATTKRLSRSTWLWIKGLGFCRLKRKHPKLS